jgi:uncharacterized phiE125 gp8 family phage protein
MIIRVASHTTQTILKLGEVKEHLRIDYTHEDELLRSMIEASKEQAENKTKRSLQRTQYELTLDDFPYTTNAISLPFPPLATESSDVVITYLDETSGNTTTLPATAYTVDWKSEPGRVYPSHDNEWPDVYDVRNAVTITFYSGYSTCPEAIKTWMKLQVGAMYENREAMSMTMQNSVSLPRPFLDGMLDGYILPEAY